MQYAVAAILNLIPGFGLGYLLVGRRRAFLLSLIGWVALVMLVVFTAAEINYFAGIVEDYPDPWTTKKLIGGIGIGWALGVVFIGIPTGSPLIIFALRSGELRRGALSLALTLASFLLMCGGLLLILIVTVLGIDTPPIVDVALSPASDTDFAIFAATEGGDMFRSINSGDTWERLNPAPFRDVYYITVSPAFETDATLFAGTTREGLFRSTDAGNTWERVTIGPSEWARNVKLSPAYDMDVTMFAGSRVGLFRSTDGGDTWEKVLGGSLVPFALSPAFETDATLFALDIVSRRLHRSTDGGDSWEQLNDPPFKHVYSLSVSPAFENDATLFAVASGGLFRSTNGGDTWKHVDPASMSDYNELSLSPYNELSLSPAFEADATVFIDTSGLFRSTDGGDTWAEVLSTSAFSAALLALSPAFETDHTIFARDSISYLRSTDAGDTWERLNIGPYRLVYSLALSPTFEIDATMFAFSGWRFSDRSHGWLYRSTTNGDTWHQVNLATPTHAWIKVIASVLGVGFAMLLAAAIVVKRKTRGLRSVEQTWKLLWFVVGLGVIILLVAIGFTYSAISLVALGVLISVLLGVGLVVPIGALGASKLTRFKQR